MFTVDYNTEEIRRICTDEIYARNRYGEELQKELYILLNVFDSVPSLNAIYNMYSSKHGKVKQLLLGKRDTLSLYINDSFDLIFVPTKKGDGDIWRNFKFPDEFKDVDSIKIIGIEKKGLRK